MKNMQRDCGYSKRAGLPRLYVGLVWQDKMSVHTGVHSQTKTLKDSFVFSETRKYGADF